MSLSAHILVSPERIIGEIDPRIYGQYIENVEPDDRVIYGGVCDDDGELRPPVIEALREMQVPMIRWGGNYGDVYRWADGIGPRKRRPRRPNYFWGGEESNRFGTHEFLDLCAALSAQPYININMGSGDLLEALAWLEYCNYRGSTAYTDLRRENGRDEPWAVPVWGIGNEAWGPWEACFAPPELYVRDFNQYAQYMRRLDPTIGVVAVGHTDRKWNEAVLRGMSKPADFLSVHMYGHSHLGKPGNFEQLVALPVAFEQGFRDVVADLETYAAAPIPLALDEWNVRHFVDGRLNRKSPRQAQDALFVAGVFNVMHRFSNHVKIGSYVTMVNGNAPLRAWDDTITRTPVYEVFRLYQQWMTGSAVAVDVAAHSYSVTPFDGVSTPHNRSLALSAPLVDASASVDAANGLLTMALVNRHAEQPVTTCIDVGGPTGYTLDSARRLRADNAGDLAMIEESVSSAVRPGRDNQWEVTLDPCSIVWLRWKAG